MVSPLENPFLENPYVITPHQLKATGKIRFNPTIDVFEPVRENSPGVSQLLIHRNHVVVSKPLDDHTVCRYSRLSAQDVELGRRTAKRLNLSVKPRIATGLPNGINIVGNLRPLGKCAPDPKAVKPIEPGIIGV
jgi:hypothetical protein